MRRAIRKKGAKFPKEFAGPLGVARLYRYPFNQSTRISFAVYHKVGAQRRWGRKTFADFRQARKYAARIVRKAAGAKGAKFPMEFAGPAGLVRLCRYEYDPRPRVEYRVYYKIGRRKSAYKHFANYRAARESIPGIVG